MSTLSNELQDARTISLSPWEVNQSGDIVNLPNGEYSRHPDTKERLHSIFKYAKIPDKKNNYWNLAPLKDGKINYGSATSSRLSWQNDYNKFRRVDFTYFRAFLDLTSVKEKIESATITIGQVDDQARMILFNSKNSKGYFIQANDAQRGGANFITDFKDYLVKGEINTFIIIQADDNPKGNILTGGITVAINNAQLKPDIDWFTNHKTFMEKGKYAVPKNYPNLKTKENQTAPENTVYDTSDPETKKELLNKLKKIKSSSLVKTDGGTKEKPVEIKIGFVFCDFTDVEGLDVETEYKILTGENNELKKFVSQESNGTAKISIERYNGENSRRGWVRLGNSDSKKGYASFKNNPNSLIEALDKLIEFPDEWQIVILAFPNRFKNEKDTKGYVEWQNGDVFTHSQCMYNKMLDEKIDTTTEKKGDIKNLVFMDPSVYREKKPVNITIHEMVHGLGLPDLYNSKIMRSYGWSIMSDCRSGYHLLGVEKILLGWESIDNYLFLKNGVTEVSLEKSNKNGLKGVIVLPHDNESSEFYFMEVAQEIGKTDQDIKEFTNRGPGLLVMVMDTLLSQGAISPFVNKISEQKNINKYGGACEALYYPNQSFATNGISWKVIKSIDEVLKCEFIVDEDYQSFDTTELLRENERILTQNQIFRVSMTGELYFGLLPVKVGKNIEVEENSKILDYGICAFVDSNGFFRIASATADSIKSKPNIVRTFYPKNIALAPNSEYFFKIETKEDKVLLNVYQKEKNNPIPKLKYQLFEQTYYPTIYNKGWSIEDGDYSLTLQDDGNLVLAKNRNFIWGSMNNGDAKTKDINSIVIDNVGSVHLLDIKNEKIKSFSGKSTQSPFHIALNIIDNTVSLDVKDMHQKTTYSIPLIDKEGKSQPL